MRATIVAAAVAAAVVTPTAANATYRDVCVNVDENNASATITTTAGLDTPVNPVRVCLPF